MKKKIKNFCAGLTLTLLLPAFFGGQFTHTIISGDTMGSTPKISLKKIMKKEDPMEKAIAILP